MRSDAGAGTSNCHSAAAFDHVHGEDEASPALPVTSAHKKRLPKACCLCWCCCCSFRYAVALAARRAPPPCLPCDAALLDVGTREGRQRVASVEGRLAVVVAGRREETRVTTAVLIDGWWGCDETRRERDPIDWLLARRWSALPARRIRISGWLRYSVAAVRVRLSARRYCDRHRPRTTAEPLLHLRSPPSPGRQNHAAVTMMKAEKKKCSRVGLTVHNNEANNPGQSSNVELVEEKPSFEEVTAWGTSFDRLMKHRSGQKFFAEFLKSEYSDENILFWQACEELKREKNPEKIEEKARIIYEDFISILSPKEVSLDSRVREIINNNMVHPSAHTFDEAQNQIFTLMHRDSYPRFVASALYKKIAASYGDLEEL
uniref:RGS domain-containing protein n=1 Tax=Plectus sambesii TaxID=2011161 RepID=A0A914VQV1_9BILA